MIVEILCSVCGKKVRIVQQSDNNRPFAHGFQAVLICASQHETALEIVEVATRDGVSMRIREVGNE